MQRDTKDPFKWSETLISRSLANIVFKNKAIVQIPNCTLYNGEVDLLVVAENLKVIDVEVKISRADLLADAKKDKWWQTTEPFQKHGNYWSHRRLDKPRKRAWPSGIWKHYYAMPKEIWRDEMGAAINVNSGVLLLSRRHNQIDVECIRRAVPNPEAKPLETKEVFNVARLAGIRMWATYARLDYVQEQLAARNSNGKEVSRERRQVGSPRLSDATST